MGVSGENGVTERSPEPYPEVRNVVVKPPSPSPPETVDQRKVKNWRKAKSVNTPEFFFGVAEEMRVLLLDLVVTLCKEMQAVEVVRRELSEEFEGEDLGG